MSLLYFIISSFSSYFIKSTLNNSIMCLLGSFPSVPDWSFHSVGGDVFDFMPDVFRSHVHLFLSGAYLPLYRLSAISSWLICPDLG